MNNKIGFSNTYRLTNKCFINNDLLKEAYILKTYKNTEV